MSHTYIESHGVRLDIEVRDAALMPAVEAILPPGWQASKDFPEDGHFIIAPAVDGLYDVLAEDLALANGVTADVAVHVLDAQMRARIAFVAPEQIFVHAGVVAVDGRALVLPAPSFSGKSALVAALVGAGATYLSDEFAVLDLDGRIHPYAKPLSLRSEDGRYGDFTPVETLGGTAASEPVRAALIVKTKYVPGARWEPAEHDPGVGALAMLANAVPAQDRPREALETIGRAAEGARVLEGDRGDADETAALLLEALRP